MTALQKFMLRPQNTATEFSYSKKSSHVKRYLSHTNGEKLLLYHLVFEAYILAELYLNPKQRLSEYRKPEAIIHQACLLPWKKYICATTDKDNVDPLRQSSETRSTITCALFLRHI